MANASLISQRVQEIHLINKLEKNGQVQLDSSFSLNVSFVPDGSRCIGKLQQTLRDKEFAGGKFTMTIEMVGVFSCTEAYKDEVKRQIHGEVYDQLFPYMQSQVTALAAGAKPKIAPKVAPLTSAPVRLTLNCAFVYGPSGEELEFFQPV